MLLVIIFYDHTFPLRYKAQKGMKKFVPSHNIKKRVKILLEETDTPQSTWR